jgi:3-methylfumaryl-CoA hydratase
MLDEWIGRQEQADDEVSLTGARRLAALLDRPVELKAGGVIPAHWYVMLFTPTAPQSQLGPDGHPRKGQFLPPVPLPRRMFAGRRCWFKAPLNIGDAMTRVSRIQAITPKTGRSGQMCFVTVRHEISNPKGVAVIEEQDIVYRGEAQAQADAPANAEAAAKPEAAPRTPEWTQAFNPDTTTLFRYSAITFNAHRIHYDAAYARDTEGYPGLVVNGGLTTLALWDFVIARTGRAIKSSIGRNLKPLFAGDNITLAARTLEDGKLAAWAVNGQGATAVELSLELGAA